VLQVRIHGRGGQGVVTAAELLSVAAFAEGRHAQAFPSFGSERTGAPVVSFCRIDDRPIRTRETITEPDVVIVQDATLLGQIDVFGGLREAGYVVVNSPRPFAELGLEAVATRCGPGHVCTVPATALALAHVGRPVPNAVLLGAFAALTGAVSLHSVLDTVTERFEGRVGRANAEAAAEAYRLVRPVTPEVTRAAS
jgi:pyruvate ferredoxin oxidoreductase gamma subunit